MSAMAKLGQKISTRYLWAKLNAARDVVLNELATSSQPSSGVLQMFQDAFNKPLTSVIAVTGAAMAPAINPVRLTLLLQLLLLQHQHQQHTESMLV
jgi:hypothetical protein